MVVFALLVFVILCCFINLLTFFLQVHIFVGMIFLPWRWYQYKELLWFQQSHVNLWSENYFDVRSRWGTWLAQSVEWVTLDLGVMISSPTLGIELTKKEKFFSNFFQYGHLINPASQSLSFTADLKWHLHHRLHCHVAESFVEWFKVCPGESLTPRAYWEPAWLPSEGHWYPGESPREWNCPFPPASARLPLPCSLAFLLLVLQISEKYGLPVEKITKLYKKSKKG